MRDNSCQISISTKSINDDINECLVQISPIDDVDRAAPCHIVCVVDVSGSMSSFADVQNPQGVVERTGLTVLDVVKHAVRTIVGTLRPEDRISIVKYSTGAELVCGPVRCDETGKKSVNRHLETLIADGSTNLWAGLLEGLNVIQRETSELNNFVFLLTDGLPNMVPPRGHEQSLKMHLDKFPKLRCSISTFGFGYHLENALLQNLATIGQGSFNFIPDGGMVGTVFIHATANAMATIGQQARVLVECGSGATLVESDPAVLSDSQAKNSSFPKVLEVHKVSNGFLLELGNIQAGCQRSFVFNVKDAKNVTASLTYRKPSSDLTTLDAITLDTVDESAFSRARSRQVILGCLQQLNLRLWNADFIGEVEAFERQLQNESDAGPYLEDLRGQVSIAVSNGNYHAKWGLYYIPSLMFAHKLEICTNFKDPGVQVYGGGVVFNLFREKAEEVFEKLPAPKPTYDGYIPNAVPVDMSRLFLSSSNPCFSATSSVTLMNGTRKFVSQVRAGDMVATGDAKSFAKVVCVVETTLNKAVTMITFASGLEITPYHPVKIDGSWIFPKDASGIAVTKEYQTSIYSFVLEDLHSVMVNDVQCVTLGHGFEDNDVVKHDYLGTMKVIRDLQRMPGWFDGKVVLESNPFTRDPATNLICGLRALSEN